MICRKIRSIQIRHKYKDQMAHPHPLYDELVKRASTRTSDVDITKVSTIINNIYKSMDEDGAHEHYRELGALLIHMQYKQTGVIPQKGTFAFKGKIMAKGKGVVVQAKEVKPVDCLAIIAEYIEMHM